MRTSRLFLALALSFLCLPLARGAAAQDGADPAKQIEKFERYLERKPYHDWAFDQLMEAAVKSNAVATLVTRYEGRTAAGASSAERVVYARLLARVDRVDEALQLLRAIESPPPALWRLVGSLELRRGAPAAAVEALDRAVEGTTDRQELEALHRARGEAYLAAGDSERAILAFRALAGLAPDDFQLRLEAASSLAQHGLTRPALEEFDTALALAAEDVARRCRVLSELGRLHEQLGQGDEALRVYGEALGLMGRGNWLKRDLTDRVVGLHRRTKSLEALVTSAAAAASAAPGDLDAAEFHARALREVERFDEAAAVLAAATASFPSDVALARSRIELLREMRDVEGVIAEYQRILGEKPDELDLYLELGQAFAASGQLEQAKRQWQKTLGERLDDPGLAARLAAMYGLYGEVDDAVAMYEKAIELEPHEIVRYADLATYSRAVGRDEALIAVLERAETIAADDPGKLDEIAMLWREFEQPERARRVLERALALAPDDPKLLRRYADVQLASDDLAGGTASLKRVIELGADANTRRSAVDRAIQAWWRAGREEELLASVATSTTVPDRLLHAKLLVRRRDANGALAAYSALVAAAPGLEEGREAYAKLLEEAGEFTLALDQYDALVALRPQNRRKYLKDIAAIHLERFDQEAAFECYDEILSSSPDNAAAFREVAKAYEQLGLVDKAIECHLQAVRLDPTDGLTRLALAELFRGTGEWERGEREIIAAFEAKDESARKRARETYHALLAAEGRLAPEMAALRERIAKNPYDLQAPITLTDLYVRELEYELAVDMLDELLAYQANEPRLLRERARVLTALERHGEAVETYETLWKLPGADQRALALDIADAHIKRGDRARAEEVLTQMGDPDALARAYERNDLMDLAIETLKQSLQRRPNDQRLLDRLARLQERVRDHEGAVVTVERLAELTGESWRNLKRLGERYHAAGRREDALAVGVRLFALVRVEDVPEPPRDEEDENDKKKGRGAKIPQLARTLSTWNTNAYDQRLEELRSWYTSIEAPTEFADVAASELRLQPTNDKLLMLLVNTWGNEEERGAELYEVVAGMRAATVDQGRTPPGMTQEQWRNMLDGYIGRLATKDAVFGRERVAALEAKLAEGTNPALSRELADTQLDLGEREAALATLQNAVAAHPDDPFVRAGCASVLQSERRFAEAAEHWRTLVAQLRAGGVTNEEPADERELAFRSSRATLIAAFPIHLQRRLSDADLRRHHALSMQPRLESAWTLGARTPTPGGVQLELARCLHELGDDDGARAEIAALAAEVAPESASDDPTATSIPALSLLVDLCVELDLDDDARAFIQRLLRIEEALEVHPVHGFNRDWIEALWQVQRSYAKILERQGDLLGAYDALREANEHDEAKLLLEEHSLHDAAVAHYEARAAAALETVATDSSSWRDAMVKLAEVHMHARRFDACLATYEAIAARDPEDFEVRDANAKLLERAQRPDEAIVVHEAIVATKRAANRRSARPTVPPRPRLTPVEVPRAEGDNSWAWDNLRYAGRFGASTGAGKYSVTEHYAAILKLLLDRREVDRATEVMMQIAREDARNMWWLSYSFGQILGQYRLEAEGVPILRLLHSYDDTDENLTIAYGNALMAAKRFDEARRIYRTFLDGAGGQSYYREEAARQLAAAEKRLGIEDGGDLGELEAKVASDPKNAKARLALAQRLVKDKEDEAALEHALAAEAVAPHLDEVRALVRRLLQINGKHEELEARLVKELDSLTDSGELVEAASLIADWMEARGDRAAADALWERVRRKSGGRFEYASPADWYTRQGDVARAIEELELDLQKVDPWYKDRIRRKIAGLRVQLGDPTAVLAAVWEDFEKASAKGDKGTILSLLLTPMLAQQADPERLALFEANAREQSGLRAELELAALEMVRGDTQAGEARILALARSDRAHAFLYPTLVDLARGRKDLAQALVYLEELSAMKLASESGFVSTSIGHIAEADALRAEIGSLRLELGDKEGALAAFGEMFEPDDEVGMQVLAKLYNQLKLWPEALAAQRAYIAKSGARNQQSLRELADLLYEAGEVDESLATFERLLLLVESDQYQRNEVAPRIMRLYREAGRLDTRREMLRARLVSDADDVNSALELARLEAEIGDTDRAQALVAGVAERADQLEQSAPVLIRAARSRGDLEEAGRWYEKLIAGNSQEWTRRNHATAYGKILIERGDVDRAIEVVLSCFPDREGEEALSAVVSLLVGQREHERALELISQLVAVAAKPEDHVQTHVSTLRALERNDEALAVLAKALVDPKHAKPWMHTSYREADVDGHELERVEAALAAAPDDADLMLRWVALTGTQDSTVAPAVDEHLPRRIELLERLHSVRPKDVDIHQMLARELCSADRHAEALPHLEALLERLDRDRAREVGDDNWEIENKINTVRSLRAQAAFEAHGTEAGIAAQLDQLGLKYSSSRRSSTSGTNARIRRLNALVQFGLDDVLRAEYEPLTPEERKQVGSSVDARLRALTYRAGEREPVLRELERRAFALQTNPLVAQTQPNDGGYYYDEFGSMYQSSSNVSVPPLARELIGYLHEEDRLGDLRTRVAALLEKQSEHATLKAISKEIERRIASDAGEDLAAKEALERKEKELTDSRKRLEEDPHNPQSLIALARLLLRNGDGAEEALDLLTRAEPMVRGLAYSGLQERVVVRRQYGAATGGVRFRFATADGSSYSSGYSSWSSSSDGNQQEFLRLLAAARFASGDREGGLATEAEIERLGATSSGGWVYDPFTQSWTQGSQTVPLYISVGLDVEVERVAEAELQKIARECVGDPRREASRRGQLADQILSGFAQRKERPPAEELRARWVAERRATWEAYVAEQPKRFLQRERAYLDWLSGTAKDLETWRARATALVARPEWLAQKPTAADGWLLLRLGDVEGARQRFEAAVAARRRPPSAAVIDALDTGLAYCRHASGEVEGARPALRRAWAQGVSGVDLPLLREALGLPPAP
jgi:tetratricopeptide (TPR) repeat protein